MDDKLYSSFNSYIDTDYSMMRILNNELRRSRYLYVKSDIIKLMRQGLTIDEILKYKKMTKEEFDFIMS